MAKIIITLCALIVFESARSQSLAELDSAQYFDFWVGEWTASWDEGNGVEQLGMNTIEKTLDGTVLQENFRITAGRNKGFKGTSISVFQSRFNRWKQAWADNQGGYFDLEGVFDGEKRMFQTRAVERGGKMVRQRMVFYDIADDAMTWDWEMSEDGGETWTLAWRIFYKRVK